MPHLTITDRNEVVIAHFSQARIIDDATIREIGAEMAKLPLEAAASRKLLLNFGRVEFMSSAMIGQILKLSKLCQNDKIKLKLCSITPNIMEVFTLMKLHKVLDLCKDENEAIEGFTGGGGIGGWFRRG